MDEELIKNMKLISDSALVVKDQLFYTYSDSQLSEIITLITNSNRDKVIKAINIEAGASLTKYAGHASAGYIEKAEMGAFSRSLEVVTSALTETEEG
jgi:hypothetical protein